MLQVIFFRSVTDIDIIFAASLSSTCYISIITNWSLHIVGNSRKFLVSIFLFRFKLIATL